MPKTPEDLAVIMALDNARRSASVDELVALAQSYYAPESVDAYCYSRSITGIPSNRNRTYRVMPNSFTHHNYRSAPDAPIKNRRTRAVGGDVTVTHADGTTEVRAVSSFRKTRIATKQRAATQARVVDAAQSYQDRVAQLGAVGNID